MYVHTYTMIHSYMMIMTVKYFSSTFSNFHFIILNNFTLSISKRWLRAHSILFLQLLAYYIYLFLFFFTIASGSLFIITACLAVWKYGGNTTANILEAVPSGPVANVAILLAALQLCFSSVIGYSALFQHLEDQWSVQRSKKLFIYNSNRNLIKTIINSLYCYVESAFGWKRCAMRSAVIFLSIMVGESVSRFDIVMALIGGSLTGSLVFVLPPLIYTQILALKKNLSQVAITEKRIYSGFCKRSKRFNDEEQRLMDPGAHSHSIYYGFLSTTNNPRRYRMFNYIKEGQWSKY